MRRADWRLGRRGSACRQLRADPARGGHVRRVPAPRQRRQRHAGRHAEDDLPRVGANAAQRFALIPEPLRRYPFTRGPPSSSFRLHLQTHGRSNDAAVTRHRKQALGDHFSSKAMGGRTTKMLVYMMIPRGPRICTNPNLQAVPSTCKAWRMHFFRSRANMPTKHSLPNALLGLCRLDINAHVRRGAQHKAGL